MKNQQPSSLMYISLMYISLFTAVIITSCVKESDDKPTNGIITRAKGIYVLNEGLYGMNNTTLTYFDVDQNATYSNFFRTQNNRDMGDTGTDIAIYGGKMYAVVSNSSQVEVMNAHTGKSIRQIPLFNGQTPRNPRFITFFGSKAWVCSFDGTAAVIDTTSLQVERIIQAGRNPDGITAANGKIYVANSGGLDFPNFDNTVSVIDPATQIETIKIQTGLNPYTLQGDAYGDLYVISRGNYFDLPSRLQIINTLTNTLKHTFDGFEAMNLTISGDTAYVYHYDYMTGESKILVLNVKTEQVLTENFISDGTSIETIYGIAVDAKTGDVYIADARGFVNTGKVFCYSNKGVRKFSFETGLNPNRIVFVRE